MDHRIRLKVNGADHELVVPARRMLVDCLRYDLGLTGTKEAFERWYNDEHLPERLEIPGYVSARRFKLEEGNGVLKYLCIWELEDGSPLESDQYKAQRARPSDIRDRANKYITQRARGLYKQIYPLTGAYEDHSGYYPEQVRG